MNDVWNFMRDFDTVRRFFDSATQSTGLGGILRRPFQRVSFLPGRAARAYPLLNVSQDQDHVYIDALAPGLDVDSIDLSVLNGEIRISGRKAALPEGIEAQAYHRSERATGRFLRTMTLPAEVDQNRAQASYTNGLLHITVPKAEKAKRHSVEID